MRDSNFTALPPQDGRKVALCKKCGLVQFDNERRCIRCHSPKHPEGKPPAVEEIEMERNPAVAAQSGVDFGGAIRVMRLALGISQGGLADQMGLCRTYISKLESRGLLPYSSNLERFADALQLPLPILIQMAESLGDYNRRNPA